MTPTNDIAVKIKKLFELAAKNNSEEESNSAMAAAQRLMAKYNLDTATVEAANGDKAVSEGLDVKRTNEHHKRGAMYEYQQRLWATVASVNYCWHFLVPVYKRVETYDKYGYAQTQHRKVTNQHRLVGREANVISAKLMGDYLEETINRLCPYQGKQALSRSAISWKEGCASRLQARLRDRFVQLEDESVKAAEGSTALTLINVKEQEYNANYAFLYGQKALDDMLRRMAEHKAARQQKIAQAVVDAPAEKPETNAQRKKREAREQREQERYQRKQDKYWERRDLSAWYSGREKAEEVNLDAQVNKSKGERSLE